MTKTEIKKAITQAVLEMLTNKYNAYNIDDEMGGRICFSFDSESGNVFTGEYHRSYNDIYIDDNMVRPSDEYSDDTIRWEEGQKYDVLLNEEVGIIVDKYLAAQ
tara:strand:+ start:19 stop:330 length:312 start_codon:yes stop_codon:yes gene_type:complete